MTKKKQKPREWLLAVRGDEVLTGLTQSEWRDALRGFAGWAVVRVREVLPKKAAKR